MEESLVLCLQTINHRCCKGHKSWLFMPFNLSSLAADEGDLNLNEGDFMLLGDIGVLICFFFKKLKGW